MLRLEDLQPNASIRGILPESLVTVVNVNWFGSEALELTYKDPGGRVANQLLYRHDEPRLEVAQQGRPWSFDGDGSLLRLVSEAHRIRKIRKPPSKCDSSRSRDERRLEKSPLRRTNTRPPNALKKITGSTLSLTARQIPKSSSFGPRRSWTGSRS